MIQTMLRFLVAAFAAALLTLALSGDAVAQDCNTNPDPVDGCDPPNTTPLNNGDDDDDDDCCLPNSECDHDYVVVNDAGDGYAICTPA